MYIWSVKYPEGSVSGLGSADTVYMLVFSSLLPVLVVVLLHHVFSHPETDTPDTAKDTVTQHVQVLKTSITLVGNSFFM